MDWEKAKSNIYYDDGTTRDIYVLNAIPSDWEKWKDFVNNNCELKFYLNIDDNYSETDKINVNVVETFWTGKNTTASVTIKLSRIEITCCFFSPTEIEHFIYARSFESFTLEDHIELIKFMRDLSIAIDKKVVLTPEGCPEIELISTNNEQTTIRLDYIDSFFP